jgi:hypothetical protein
VTAVPFLLALAACAAQPFDATSPWQPLEGGTGEGRAYRGGQQAQVPTNVFDEFEPGARDRQTAAAPSGPQSRVPDPRSGENPWATIPENPVVTVCFGAAFNDPAQVEAAARRLCPEGARLELIQTSTFQSECPLLQPTRAAFRCWTDGGDRAAEATGDQ